MDKLDYFSLWSDPSPELPSAPEQVHVWTADLDLEPERLGELELSLAPDEWARADRFRFAGDRRRFVAARGTLRVILSRYLNCSPQHVRISCTPAGKPMLPGVEGLRFNLSHSDSLALVAVTREREIGVDVERLRTNFDPLALAKRFFSPTEYAALCRLPPPECHAAFLTCWTCKEAYLKVVGTGLRCPLRGFTVSWDDGSITLTDPADGEAIAPYHLQRLNPPPGYVAALATERVQ